MSEGRAEEGLRTDDIELARTAAVTEDELITHAKDMEKRADRFFDQGGTAAGSHYSQAAKSYRERADVIGRKILAGSRH